MKSNGELIDLGGWPTILATLTQGNDLTAETAEACLRTVLAGEATPAQIAAFVVGLRQKGETVEEMTGMVRAMRAAATPLDLPAATVDLVGAGGSVLGREAALNVSTMASVVAAAAGATVCKHGNRKASSTSGSFDVLEALGVAIDIPAEGVETCVTEAGVGFAYARRFHPAMRFAAPVRAELGIPTVFNILGPLSHPGQVTRQVVGVPDPAVGERMIAVLSATGSERTLVVTGAGGLDELSTTGVNVVFELRAGEITRTSLDPTELGLAPASLESIRGGDAETNAALTRALLAGEGGPVHDIVVLNAAAGLMVADEAVSFVVGIEAATHAIESGRAAEVLDRLIEVSNRFA